MTAYFIMRRKTNLLNKKIGFLTVVGEAKTKKTLVRWKCLCVCGKTCIKYANDLKRNRNSISCGCKSRLFMGRKKYDPLTRSAARIYTANYKYDSDLSLKEFIELSQKNCFYCGAPPSNTFCDKKGAPFIYNGLDRIDSSLDHRKSNCVPCCKRCNVAKSNFSIHEFYEWVYRIIAHKTYE